MIIEQLQRMNINIVWELSIADMDGSVFFFPIEKERTRFNEIMNGFVSKGLLVGSNWQTPFILKKEERYNYSFFYLREPEDEMEITENDEPEDVICVNEQVYEKLHPLLKNEVEFLPMQSDDGIYYVMNVINIVDCLDKKACVCAEAPNGLIIDYSELVFDAEKTRNQHIFRTPELPFTIFVMDSLRKLLQYFEEVSFTEDELVFDGISHLLDKKANETN